MPPSYSLLNIVLGIRAAEMDRAASLVLEAYRAVRKTHLKEKRSFMG